MPRGYIRGAEGEPIAAALLILNTNAYVADEEGKIEVPPGEHDATVMHRDYKTQRSRIKLERDFTIVMERI